MELRNEVGMEILNEVSGICSTCCCSHFKNTRTFLRMCSL